MCVTHTANLRVSCNASQLGIDDFQCVQGRAGAATGNWQPVFLTQLFWLSLTLLGNKNKIREERERERKKRKERERDRGRKREREREKEREREREREMAHSPA